jgi:membrane-bound lytic murein transglycosylase D
MRTLVQIAGIVGLVMGLAAATAQADDRATGVQPDPPGPAAKGAEVKGQDAGNRRGTRGCPIDQDCRPLHEQLRDFEIEAFPPPGGDPWIDGGDQGGGALVERTSVSAAAKPSEVRADAAWMDDLDLPDLPVRWDPRVIEYLEFYKDDKRGRSIMRGWLEAQTRYAPMIAAELDKKGLPADLLYVAMIESSYDAYEYSRAGASGLWQFMPASGQIYGLTIDRWVDERNDPVRSTQAACDFFADLYQRFGDWDLALAAYNAGYGNVIRAIARFNTNDFWALLDFENALPWESGIYVPKAVAAAIVGHNREAFGFADVKGKAPEEWDDVTVSTSVSLSVIAKAAGTTAAEIKRLNPALRRGRTPPGVSYVLRVPEGGAEKFATRFAQLRGDWDGYDAYVVAHGERFEDVATMFGISKKKLMALNEVDTEAEIGGGTILVVPKITEAERTRNVTKAREALYSSGIDQKKGELLLVPVPDKDAQIDGKRRVFYRVVSGDGLEKVSKALGVKRKDLATWNGLEAEAKLQAKMVLQAWVAEDFDPDAAHVAVLDESRLIVVTRGSKEHLDLAEKRVGRERIEYTAKKRESFEKMGKKYGLTARDVARINRRPHSTVVEAGETIIVYRVVDKNGSDRAAKQWKAAPKKKKSKKGDRPRADAGEEAEELADPDEPDEPAEATAEVDDPLPAEEPAEAPAEASPKRAASTDEPVSSPDDVE